MLQVAKDMVMYFQKAGDKIGTAGALHLVAAVNYKISTRRDEPREAKRAADAAIAFYKDLGDIQGQMAVLTTVIEECLEKEKLDLAQKAAEDLMVLAQELRDTRAKAMSLEKLSSIYLKKD